MKGSTVVVSLVIIVVVSEVFFVLYSATWRVPTPLSHRTAQGRSRTVSAEGQLAVLNETLSFLRKELQGHVDSLPQPPPNPRQPRLAAIKPPPPPSLPPPAPAIQAHSPIKNRRALIYTMDSMSAYEEQSRSGGAAGEILIRRCLEGVLQELGVSSRVVRNDAEFDAMSNADVGAFDFLVLDPWTWAAKGWVPKAGLLGHDDKVYILDFFGAPKLRGTGLKVPPTRVLTAYGSAWNSFLGFYLSASAGAAVGAGLGSKEQRGVVWGKDTKHFDGKAQLLIKVLDHGVKLVSTATEPVFRHAGIEWTGHRTPEKWTALLRGSKFLLGLGDPLLGPSAIEALSHGCVYINPVYADRQAHKNGEASQHSWAVAQVGAPYVCSYREGSVPELLACIDAALKLDLPPLVPPAFTKEAYVKRVRGIFRLT